jgi:4-amino-4-deoxy-L-arabinose transferase-like glycosyltransferase
MGLKVFLMFLACTILVGACVWLVAPTGEKRKTMWLAGLGLVFALGKIWLFQQAPQWQDINPDSIVYELNARAFALHWQGETILAEDYKLRGFLGNHSRGDAEAEWKQEDVFTWASVIGSTDCIYTIYVALWYWLTEASQGVVIFSNAIWAAFFPAAAFCIALLLGGSRKVAFFAAILALIDPSAGVNASWLLKDTLIGFLAMSSLCGMLRIIREGNWLLVPYFCVLCALLSVGRYSVFFGLLCASVLLMAYMVYRRQIKSMRILAFSMLIAWCLSGVLINMPQALRLDVLSHASRSFFGAVDVFQRGEGDRNADETTVRWKEDFANDPVVAVVKSVAHTLFAPYPWVALSPGLNWHSFSELYYPGVVLWIICLPGIFRALLHGVRKRDFVFWLLLLFLASQLAAYTIWFGEWSTRQRVFALPAFFALAAIGWTGFYEHWQRMRSLQEQIE